MKIKKEIIEVGGRYYGRYKKWYNLKWRYAGLSYSHDKPQWYLSHHTEKGAEDNLYRFLGEFNVIKILE